MEKIKHKVTKTGDYSIIVEFFVKDNGKFQKIGEVELYYNNDTVLDKTMTQDEWTLSYRNGDDEEVDPEIISQGNVTP